jgi:hypothetical protein
MGNNIPPGCSPLATYYNDATHYDRAGRIYNGVNNKIDTITIHCYVSQVTAKQGCDNFAKPNRAESSCNYMVGYDGSIGVSVPEYCRSYCTGGHDPRGSINDYRAVTIEVASDTFYPYAVTEQAYYALLLLVFDICSRNGIKKLIWSTEKATRVHHKGGCNMTVHRDYADKSCPGDFLYERHGHIAASINEWLTRSAGDISFEPYVPTMPPGTVFAPWPGGGSTPVQPPAVPIVDIAKLSITDITATALTALIQTNKNFSKYAWSYLITPLGSKNTKAHDFKMTSESITFTINSLSPNTAYYLEAVGASSSGTTVKTQRMLICTKQAYPKSVRNLQASLTSKKDFCNISFSAPEDWGDSGEGRNRKGYRISLLINGSIISQSDTLISYSSGSIDKKIPLASLLNGASLQPTNILQIGVQTWVSDTQDGLLFDSSMPVCSKPIYLHLDIPRIARQYVKLNNAFKRVILHDNIK